jgi:SAM-dependent methyltransferase
MVGSPVTGPGAIVAGVNYLGETMEDGLFQQCIADAVSPERCFLCGRAGAVEQAGFRQIYRQVGAEPITLPWWECHECRGWFVHPVPTTDQIDRHCRTAIYNRPSHAAELSQGKASIQSRILARLSDWTSPGPLLDFGCSFGEFLVCAGQAGWTPSGFDPNGDAAGIASRKGCDVRCGWVLEEAGFPEKHFSAVTAIDSFYYAWHPYETLRTFHRLLEPGGVLAMRLTNKRSVLGLLRALSRSGYERDSRLSRMLQGQFHSISMRSLASVLDRVGFDRIVIEPQAVTAPCHALSGSTRLAYGLARVVSSLTFKRVNWSPGVLLFARKAA